MTDIKAIEARAAAATPGPWSRTGTNAKPHWYVSSDTALVHGPALIREPDTVQQTVDRWVADADFIAHARDDIPALLALTKQLAEVVEAADSFVTAQRGWRNGLVHEGYVLMDRVDAYREATR